MDALTSFYTAEIGLLTVFTRLAVAACLGLVIGLDREYRSSPAGMRTHMLVSLAAATFAVLAFEIIERVQTQGQQGLNADPVRVIEAVTAGVAFLAAGTIIQARGQVHGLTTGAAMWLAGSIGLACGVGAYAVALMATILGITILIALGWFEDYLFKEGEDNRRKVTREDREDEARRD